MTKLLHGFLLVVISFQLAVAAESPPSDVSIRDLMTITESRKLLDGVAAQMDGTMQSAMQQALQGRNITPDQQRILDDMRGQLVALFQEEMTWESLEPSVVDMYKKTFTQGEIDGIIEFYKSPAGKAVIAKMPLVMQNNMQLVQSRMNTLLPKLQRLQQETFEKLKATQRQ